MKYLHIGFFIVLLSGFLPVFSQNLLWPITHYIPAHHKVADGTVSGFFIEIVEEALTRRSGYQIQTEIHPWARCQIMVRNGLADFITTVPTPERLEWSVMVPTPFWIKQYRLFTWDGHPRLNEINSIQSIQDLRTSGLTVISYKGNNWSKTHLEDAGITVINANSVESMYRMLIAQRGDLIVEDPILVTATTKDLGLYNRLAKTRGIVEESAFHLLIGKKSQLVHSADKIDFILKQMWNDGTIERILDRYR